MNISMDQLLAILGGKEVENVLLKAEIAELRKRLSEAEAKIGSTQ